MQAHTHKTYMHNVCAGGRVKFTRPNVGVIVYIIFFFQGNAKNCVLYTKMLCFMLPETPPPHTHTLTAGDPCGRDDG